MDDPRPDLEKDSQVWDYILSELWKSNVKAAANLHLVRCNGARLKYNKKQDELKLTMNTLNEEEAKEIEEDPEKAKDYEGLLTEEEFQEHIERHIKPYRNDVKTVFNEVKTKLKNK